MASIENSLQMFVSFTKKKMSFMKKLNERGPRPGYSYRKISNYYVSRLILTLRFLFDVSDRKIMIHIKTSLKGIFGKDDDSK